MCECTLSEHFFWQTSYLRVESSWAFQSGSKVFTFDMRQPAHSAATDDSAEFFAFPITALLKVGALLVTSARLFFFSQRCDAKTHFCQPGESMAAQKEPNLAFIVCSI